MLAQTHRERANEIDWYHRRFWLIQIFRRNLYLTQMQVMKPLELSLSQEIDGKERPIAFASRTLTKQEQRYCVAQKESQAVVCAMKHFKHYLYGKHFIVRTEHGSLRWLLNFKTPEGQLATPLQVLSSYHMTIIYRPGRQHRNADALSRIPCRQCGYDPNWENTENLAQHVRNL